MSPSATENKAKITTPGDREIRTERIFHAPRERVWKAMTNPELVAQWWGRGNKLVIEKFEPKSGGRWRFVEQGPQGPQGFMSESYAALDKVLASLGATAH